jgi:hypothetical protein
VHVVKPPDIRVLLGNRMGADTNMTPGFSGVITSRIINVGVAAIPSYRI